MDRQRLPTLPVGQRWRPRKLRTGEQLPGSAAHAPGFDPRGRREFMALLREVPATKLIATHDLEMVVEMCPRSIILDGGRVVADGATLELLDNEELMLAHGLERPHSLHHLRIEEPFFWKPPQQLDK